MMKAVSGGTNSRVLRCSACGAAIAVRTFKAGRIVCPDCGAERGLATDLVVRLREEAPPDAIDPPPAPEARARVRPALLVIVVVVLGATVYLLALR